MTHTYIFGILTDIKRLITKKCGIFDEKTICKNEDFWVAYRQMLIFTDTTAYGSCKSIRFRASIKKYLHAAPIPSAPPTQLKSTYVILILCLSVR